MEILLIYWIIIEQNNGQIEYNLSKFCIIELCFLSHWIGLLDYLNYWILKLSMNGIPGKRIELLKNNWVEIMNYIDYWLLIFELFNL